MKKTVTLLFAISITLFFSCSSDDKNDESVIIDQSFIPGEWSLTEVKSQDGEVSTNYQGLLVKGNYTAVGKNINGTVSFSRNKDTNVLESAISLTLVVSIDILGIDPVKFDEPENLSGTGTWEFKEGNVFITNVDNVRTFYEVISLSAKTMRLKLGVNESIKRDGNTYDIKGYQIFTFSKN